MVEKWQLPISRRSALGPAFALAALPLLGARAAGQTHDNPPVFRTEQHQFTLIQPARMLPEVTLVDLRGQAARIGPVNGKILLINLWATWCDACRLDLPLLDRFHQIFGSRVAVAAVSTERKDRRAMRDYLSRLSIGSLPVLLDPEERLANNSANSEAPLHPFGMPVTYLVTPSGRIAGYIAGVSDWLSADGRQLLAYYSRT